MKSLYPFLWRLKFILFEMWGKELQIILYTLFPHVRHKENFREKVLLQKKLISWDREAKTISVDDMVFHYPHKVPTGNIISIILGNNPYIKKNFIDNSALKQEGSYERGGVTLQKGDCVFDVGANIGIFSVLAGKKIGATGKVFSFEPIKEARELLEKNLSANEVSIATVVPLALGENNETLHFRVEPASLGSSTAVLTNKKATKSVEIEQTTLDTYVQQHNVERVDFIKADIEGMERHLLKGAEHTIKRFKPKLSICTYHFPEDPELLKSMVKEFVPEYTIQMSRTKLYAWI